MSSVEARNNGLLPIYTKQGGFFAHPAIGYACWLSVVCPVDCPPSVRWTVRSDSPWKHCRSGVAWGLGEGAPGRGTVAASVEYPWCARWGNTGATVGLRGGSFRQPVESLWESCREATIGLRLGLRSLRWSPRRSLLVTPSVTPAVTPAVGRLTPGKGFGNRPNVGLWELHGRPLT